MPTKVYWIEGDGVGKECWQASRPIFEQAIALSYGSEQAIEWVEVLAGEKALAQCGELLPQQSIEQLKKASFAIKGPLGTPIGSGFRSLNVTLRQVFDLYACIRPIKYFQGIESPLKQPEKVNMVVFRENTEDVYAGIEYAANTPQAIKLISFLRDELGAQVDSKAAIGIKPMTARGSKRLVRKAIEHAVANKLPNVTLVHKGNIMKFTEGGFRQWGYDLAAEEFAAQTITEAEYKKNHAQGKIIIKDRIADAMFQDTLLKPEEFSVIATSNLNGDYLSDALAAQVGGLGLAPGANMSDTLGFFEATHGTAPDIAGQDKVNPGSLLLSGAMLLDYMGLELAGERIRKAITQAITNKTVTFDLSRQMQGAKAVGCNEFGEIVGSLL